MAFLDNSGDIILDAVLTDTGRRRMADGNFKITRFGLGDDEINYSQYDKNHASGSAYYDLEILQTPIFQTTTQVSNINYGLLNISNKNILYMPSLEVNSLQSNMQTIFGGIYYVATNSTTVGKLSLTSNQYQDTTTQNVPAIYVEGGINSTDLAKTQSNQAAYIKNLQLSNKSYSISVDNRIFKGILALTPGQTFSVDSSGNNFQLPVNLKSVSGGTSGGSLENYTTYRAVGVNNGVYQTQNGVSVADFSAISGPGDTITAFKLMVQDSLCSATTSDNLYSKIGSTAATPSPSIGSGTYDYIDTFVYITGLTTGATISLPVRVIRSA